MKFSEYILEAEMNEDNSNYIKELLLFLEVLEKQEQTKDVKKLSDIIKYVVVKEPDKAKELYDSLLKKFQKFEYKNVEESLNEDAKFISLGLGILASAALSIAGGVAVTGGVAALGAPVELAAYVGSAAMVTLPFAIPKTLEVAADKIDELKGKYNIKKSFSNVKKKVSAKISKFKSKFKKSNTQKTSDEPDSNSTSKTSGATGGSGSSTSNPTIKEFAQAISKYDWTLNSVKKYDGYQVAWFSKPTEDGSYNSKRGWRQQTEKLFKEVKSLQKDENVWLTRYWVSGNSKTGGLYMISVAFGREPGKKEPN